MWEVRHVSVATSRSIAPSPSFFFTVDMKKKIKSRIVKEICILIPFLYILFVLINALVETRLVVYDTLPFELRPETRQRAISDFFETFPGDILPATLIICILIALMLLRWKRMLHRSAV